MLEGLLGAEFWWEAFEVGKALINPYYPASLPYTGHGDKGRVVPRYEQARERKTSNFTGSFLPLTLRRLSLCVKINSSKLLRKAVKDFVNDTAPRNYTENFHSYWEKHQVG